MKKLRVPARQLSPLTLPPMVTAPEIAVWPSGLPCGAFPSGGGGGRTHSATASTGRASLHAPPVRPFLCRKLHILAGPATQPTKGNVSHTARCKLPLTAPMKYPSFDASVVVPCRSLPQPDAPAAEVPAWGGELSTSRPDWLPSMTSPHTAFAVWPLPSHYQWYPMPRHPR